MKILAIQPFFQGHILNALAGGKNKAAHYIMEAAIKNNLEIFVLPWWGEQITQTQKFKVAEGLTATLIPTWYPPEEFTKETALKKAMETIKPDLIHVHQTHSDFAEVYHKLNYTVPIILTHHSSGISKYLKFYDHIIFVSKYQQMEAMKSHPDILKWSSVIYYFSSPEYHNSFTKTKKKTITFLGNLNDNRKGLDLLIDAYSRHQNLNKFNCRVIGNGKLLKDYETLCKSKKLNFTFLGRLTPEENAKELSESLAFVMPSRAEGLALVYIEALSTGTPIVGFKENILELNNIMNLECGLPFNPDQESIEHLANSILSTVNEKTLLYYDSLKKGASLFSLERFQKNYIKLYLAISQQKVSLREDLNNEQLLWKELIIAKCELWKNNYQNFYLYGAGKHSIKIVPLIKEFLNIKGIIDDNPTKQTLCDYEIIEPKKLILSESDAVILSSDVFQNELEKACLANWEKANILKFYSFSIGPFNK